MSPNSKQDAVTSVVLRRTHKRIAFVFLAVALLVVTSAGIIYAANNYVIASNVRQSRMLQLVYEWERLISAIREAEVRQRDFLVSGEEQDLSTYKGTANRVAPLAESIAQRETSEVGKHLIELTQRRMAILQEGAELRQKQGLEAAVAFIRTGEGRDAMGQLTGLTTRLQEGRENSVKEEMKKQDDLSRRLTSAFIILGAANVVILHWAYGRINKALEVEQASLQMRYTKDAASEQDGALRGE